MPASSSSASRSQAQAFSDAADRRQALFVARDALAAEILSRPLRSPAISHVAAAPIPGSVSPTVAATRRNGPAQQQGVFAEVPAPPLVIDILKPVAPKTWRARWAAAKRERKRRAALLATQLFDAAWYLGQYPDVRATGVDPLNHFLEHGSYEGRSPGPNFDAMDYLAGHPDVVAEKIEPWLHYSLHGKLEGRVAKSAQLASH